MSDTPLIPNLAVPLPLGAPIAAAGAPDLAVPEGEAAMFERLADLPATEPDPSAEPAAAPMAVPIMLAGFLLPRMDLAPDPPAVSAMSGAPGVLPKDGAPEGILAAGPPLAAAESVEPAPMPVAPATEGLLQLDGPGWARNAAMPSPTLAPAADKPPPERAVPDPAAVGTPSGDRSAMAPVEPRTIVLADVPSAASPAAPGMAAAGPVPGAAVRPGPSGPDPSRGIPSTTSDSTPDQAAEHPVKSPTPVPIAATAFAQIVARMEATPPAPGAGGAALLSRPDPAANPDALVVRDDPGKEVSASPTLAEEAAPRPSILSHPETEAPGARTAVLHPGPATAAALPGPDADRAQGLMRPLGSEAATGTARATQGTESPWADLPSEDRQISVPSGGAMAEKAAAADGLAAPLPGPSNAPHPLTHLAERTGSAPPASLPDAVPAQIVRAASESPAPVTEIRLSPEELGAVRIELRTEGERAIVTVTAERGDTLDLLRRHADRLASEFRSAGYSQLDLGFGQWAGTDRDPGAGTPRPEALPSRETAGPGETVPYAPPTRGPAPTATGLYLRI